MGCTQSTERAQPKAQQASEPAPQPAPAPADPVKVATPVKAEAPEPVAELAAEPEASVAAEPEPTPVPASAPAPEAQTDQPQDATAAAEDVPVEPAATTVTQPVALEQEAPQRAPATTTVPALALPQKRSSVLAKRGARAQSRSSRSTPRLQQENAASVKAAAAARAKATTPARNRGLGLANANVANTAANATDKKVYFDAVPAPVDISSKRTNKARKAAGKHGANVNEEMFLASIAAFERQLTHRASLDSQLHSR